MTSTTGVTAAWWAIGVVILTVLLQFLAALLVLRLAPTGPQSVGLFERGSLDVLAQGAIGILILWFALKLRPEMSTRRHVLLSLLGYVPLWGTLVSIAVELFLEHRETQESSEHHA